MATAETILIVDDEGPVRETVLSWLREADLGCELHAVGSAADALRFANQHTIDLAILDWNLGAGMTGLQLLEDLINFNPDIVAVMITGYADKATPLMAMRLGVRDYLDKNKDFNRDTFLAIVRRQLDHIRPARLQRRVNEGLAAFHRAVDQVLPLVQAAAALNDPVPLSSAVRSLLRFVRETTGAADAAFVARSYDESRQPAEQVRAYDADGNSLTIAVPWAGSLAASVASMAQACSLDDLTGQALQPFEQGRSCLLAVPLDVAPGVQAVLELFDRPGGFGPEQQKAGTAAALLGAEMLRHALAERESQRLLLDALTQAQRVGQEVAGAIRPPDAAPPELRARLETTLAHSATAAIDAGPTLRLAEAIRELAVRYGPPAVDHCTRLVEDLRGLLDRVAGVGT